MPKLSSWAQEAHVSEVDPVPSLLDQHESKTALYCKSFLEMIISGRQNLLTVRLLCPTLLLCHTNPDSYASELISLGMGVVNKTQPLEVAFSLRERVDLRRKLPGEVW